MTHPTRVIPAREPESTPDRHAARRDLRQAWLRAGAIVLRGVTALVALFAGVGLAARRGPQAELLLEQGYGGPLTAFIGVLLVTLGLGAVVRRLADGAALGLAFVGAALVVVHLALGPARGVTMMVALCVLALGAFVVGRRVPRA